MNLFDWIRPRTPKRPTWEPRLSDALHEVGSYKISYHGWTPASLSGDPILTWNTRVRRREAIRVSGDVIAILPSRAEIAARVLEREGLSPRGASEDWSEIEKHLTFLAEPSHEPRDASLPYLVMRPAYHAFLLDVALLFAERARIHRPELRLVRADVGHAWNAGWLRQLPRMIDSKGEFGLDPFEAVFDVGASALLGDTRGRELARYLDAGFGEYIDDDDEIRQFWDGFVQQHGRFPSDEEMAEFIVTNDFEGKDIPDDLARLMGYS